MHNHHNFAWLERASWQAVVGLPQGSDAPHFRGSVALLAERWANSLWILEGVAPDLSTAEGQETAVMQAASLCSTVHGAGRVMGRKQAAGVYDRKTGVCKREGLVKPEMMNEWMQKSNVVLRGGGLDESHHCYKRLPEVLAAHGSTIRVLHTLTPVGVAYGWSQRVRSLQGLTISRASGQSPGSFG